MRIYLSGNPYLYDVEQTAMTLMPARMPRAVAEMPEVIDRTEDYAVSKLTRTKKGVVATFTLCLDGETVTESCREIIENVSDDEADSIMRHAVRRSVFKAYSTLTGDKPAWGAL